MACMALRCSLGCSLPLRLSQNGSGKQAKFKEHAGYQARFREFGRCAGLSGSKMEKSPLVRKQLLISKAIYLSMPEDSEGTQRNLIVV